MASELAPARIHPKSQCGGSGLKCPFHDPSEHPMRSWKLVLRETALTERQCAHGVGHPDPDSVVWLATMLGQTLNVWMIHGCDGCCSYTQSFRNIVRANRQHRADHAELVDPYDMEDIDGGS